jgi:outer membrane protein assembly factor BamB
VTHHGKLAALEARSGVVRWQGDLGEVSSAIAVAGGPVHVFSEDATAHSLCRLRTFGAASGASQWSWSTGRCQSHAGTVARGVVYLTISGVDASTGDTAERDLSRIVALDSDTGRQRWSRRFDTAAQLSPPVVADRIVYFTKGHHGLVALDAESGKERWRVNLEGGTVSLPVVDQGLVHVARAWGYGESAVYAFDAETGRRRWVFKARGLTTFAAYGANTLVLVDQDGRVRGLNNQTGQPRWVREFGNPDPARPPAPAVSDGTMAYVLLAGGLHALDAGTGRVRWTDPTPPPGTPLTAHDGVVYLTASDGLISATSG